MMHLMKSILVFLIIILTVPPSSQILKNSISENSNLLYNAH